MSSSESDIIKRTAFQSISDYGWALIIESLISSNSPTVMNRIWFYFQTITERIIFLSNQIKTLLDLRPVDLELIENNFREIIDSLFSMRVIHDVKKLYYDLTGDKSMYKREHHENEQKMTSVIPMSLREISSNVYMSTYTYDRILKLMSNIKERKQLVLKTNYDKEIRYELNRTLPSQMRNESLRESVERLVEENIKLNKQISELETEKEKIQKERDEMTRKYMTTQRSLDNFRLRRPTGVPGEKPRPYSCEIPTETNPDCSRLKKIVEKYRMKEYQKLVQLNKPKQHVTFKFYEVEKVEQYDIDILKSKIKTIKFPKVKVNEQTDDLELEYIEVAYEELRKMKPVELPGSSIIEGEQFTIRIIPHFSISPCQSPEIKEVIATVPIGVILTGGNAKVNYEGKEIGIKIPQSCEDGFLSPFTEKTMLRVVYQNDPNYTREGDDLIGTYVYSQKDAGKIATLPYPADLDDLPPVHIIEGRFVFKHFGFLNTTTGKKGNYILNILIQ